MAQSVTIDRLLNLVPDSPDSVLHHLQQTPSLASKQDAHGYSLLHAATSYGHIDLAQKLVKDYNLDPNIQDEDSETALFNAESVEVAKALLELGVDLHSRNDDGQTAAEKLADPDEQPQVAAFLREAAGEPTAEAAASVTAQTNGAADSMAAQAGTVNGVHAPPPLPSDVQINMGTMQPEEAGEAPDPEFRRRIEELAARPDFQTEEGQAELRRLVEDVVGGITQGEGQGAGSRRRIG